MPITINVAPVSRIEGHLDVEVNTETVNGVQKVVDAKCSGTMFRGFEMILAGRNPQDTVHITQRICGVCPVSHGMASAMCLESAYGARAVPPANGRILRNLVLGADYLHSHILHFYQLAAPDYIDTTGVLEMSPWTPRVVTPDMVQGAVAADLVSHYVQALEMRRKSHQIGAIFGGKMPCSPAFTAGGCNQTLTNASNGEMTATTKISEFRRILTEIRSFINNVYLPDVQALIKLFPAYTTIGRGCGNLLAYGVFDLNSAGTQKLLKRGVYTSGRYYAFDPAKIAEYVKYSKYAAAAGVNPSAGTTVPDEAKPGAYSFIKAPRYLNKTHEVGPLARMWINGDYRRGISVMDRLMARAQETRKIADAMDVWVSQLVINGSGRTNFSPPTLGTGIGLTEAPRGALGHWIKFANSAIERYQVLSPTSWNASPTDDFGQKGAIEQALIGTPVRDKDQPIEVLRVIHSFDPCLACSVH